MTNITMNISNGRALAPMNANETNLLRPNITARENALERWHIPLLISEISNITMLACSIWVLISVIAYGTKTRRWKNRPGSSSLSSGLVYTACTITIALTAVRLSTTEVLFKLKKIPGGLDRCELVCDIDNAAYAACSYLAYCFLWVRLRLIYNYPYVKKRIGKRANLISKIGFVLITVAASGLFIFYAVPKGYASSPLGCVYGKRVPGQFLQGTRRNILIAVALVVAQSVLIYLCIYPALRVDFDSIADAEHGNEDHRPSHSMCERFHTAIINTDSLKSPIQLAVRRTLVSCIVMVIANVIVLIPAVIFIPRSAPAQIRRTVYNVGVFINIFCVLATLGFAVRILTLFVPSCPKRNISKVSAFGRHESVLSTSDQGDSSY